MYSLTISIRSYINSAEPLDFEIYIAVLAEKLIVTETVITSSACLQVILSNGACR
jgi:hypothetical protein